MVPLDNESLEFEDGSFTADIPRKRLSELFHVTQDIVSQVNPHVNMMLGSDSGELTLALTLTPTPTLALALAPTPTLTLALALTLTLTLTLALTIMLGSDSGERSPVLS